MLILNNFRYVRPLSWQYPALHITVNVRVCSLFYRPHFGCTLYIYLKFNRESVKPLTSARAIKDNWVTHRSFGDSFFAIEPFELETVTKS